MTHASRPTNHQQVVAELVERRLGRPLDPDLNFFEAGLDSLALVELHDEITGTLGVDLPATALFTHPNLEALGRLIAQGSAPARGDAGRRRPVGGSRRDIRARLREDGR
ncbi:acyl carrier protein [Nonomuraea sp. NPDC059194]|uniref:acyl carrier protein n=1 Tax=Nonomuraea sp. NPDC059194 TaxID=3346764 RepID=UPI00367B94FB